jgi:beta-glucosidase
VQVYIGPVAPHRPTPPKALRAFAKVALAAGESRIVTLNLEPSAFARYDDDDDRWVIDPGAYDILIGASATDIRLKQRTTLS